MAYTYVILGLELETKNSKKVHTALSKHLKILPKFRGEGNSANVWVKLISSERIFVYLVYRTCL